MCKRLLGSRRAGEPVELAFPHEPSAMDRRSHPVGGRAWKRQRSTPLATRWETTPQFLNSPVNEIHKGANEVRKNLEDLWEGDDLSLLPGTARRRLFRIYRLADRSYARQAPRRYASPPIGQAVLPANTWISARSAAGSYSRQRDPAQEHHGAHAAADGVGPHASEQILSGVITRGSGATVGAAIMICDLRDFTAISDLWPRDDVIQLLNDYFDAMSDPIERAWRRNPEIHGRRTACYLPAGQAFGLHDLLTAIREGAGGDGEAE